MIFAFVHQRIKTIHQLLQFLLVAEQIIGDQLSFPGRRHAFLLLLPAKFQFDFPPRGLAQGSPQLIGQLIANVRIKIGRLPHILQHQPQVLRSRVRFAAHLFAGLVDGVYHFGLNHLGR